MGTSGVLVFAKASGQSYRKFIADFTANHSKEYLALVDGSFPDTPPEGLECDLPLKAHMPKPHTGMKTNSKEKEYRDCKTVFHKLWTREFEGNLKCSLVRCVPLQGRTHQIRIHLKALGHPIVNDNLYNPVDVARWQNTIDIITPVGYQTVVENYSQDRVQDPTSDTQQENIDKSGEAKKLSWTERLSLSVGCPKHICYTCLLSEKYKWFEEIQLQEEKFICLHSWKYRTGDGPSAKEFEAEWPEWATSESFTRQLLSKRLQHPKKVSVTYSGHLSYSDHKDSCSNEQL